MKIIKQIQISVLICDYCQKELDVEFPDKCVVCGKDICGDYIRQCEDDGNICIDCHKKGYRIIYYNEGGVGVEKNGKETRVNYL